MPAVREIAHRIDPGEPVSDVRTPSEIVGQENAPGAVQLRVLWAMTIAGRLTPALRVMRLNAVDALRAE